MWDLHRCLREKGLEGDRFRVGWIVRPSPGERFEWRARTLGRPLLSGLTLINLEVYVLEIVHQYRLGTFSRAI